MSTLYIDCETFSELDLRTVGTYRYAENSEVMLLTWAVDDGPVQYWDLTAPNEERRGNFETALRECSALIAHNALFDRTVLDHEMITPHVPIKNWRCTMVQALSHGLPGGLDDLCTIFKIPNEQAKIKDGKRLIQLFCKPRPKNVKIGRATRETHPEEWFSVAAKMIAGRK